MRPGLLLIWGRRYAPVKEVKDIEWLNDVPLFYWGDIDTHGFAILSELRASFPQARSVLMDAETLEERRALCVDEPSPAKHAHERLVTEEKAVFESLFLPGGKAMRLEQERIRLSFAKRKLDEANGRPSIVTAEDASPIFSPTRQNICDGV